MSSDMINRMLGRGDVAASAHPLVSITSEKISHPQEPRLPSMDLPSFLCLFSSVLLYSERVFFTRLFLLRSQIGAALVIVLLFTPAIQLPAEIGLETGVSRIGGEIVNLIRIH